MNGQKPAGFQGARGRNYTAAALLLALPLMGGLYLRHTSQAPKPTASALGGRDGKTKNAVGPLVASAANSSNPPTTRQSSEQMREWWHHQLAGRASAFSALRALSPLVAKLSADELVQALATLPHGEMTEDMASSVSALLASALAEKDGGELAPEVVRALPWPVEAKKLATRAAYLGWLEIDPSAAIAHLMPRLQSELLDLHDLAGELFTSLGKQDGELAEALARSVAGQRDNPQAAFIAKRYRKEIFVERFGGGQTTEDAVRYIGEDSVDPKEAGDLHEALLQKTLDAKNYAATARLLVYQKNGYNSASCYAVGALAQTYPQEVLRFIKEGIADFKERAEAIQFVVSIQHGAVRENTLNWLESLPVGREKDLALAKAAVALAPMDASRAVRLLNVMQDSPRKTELLHNTGFEWMAKDAMAARKMLPAEVVERFERIESLQASGALELIPSTTTKLSFAPRVEL